MGSRSTSWGRWTLAVLLFGGLGFIPVETSSGQAGGNDLGQALFKEHCADCHRQSGEGLPDKFPALKGNPFVLGDPVQLSTLVRQGRRGKFGLMPSWQGTLTPYQLAAVLSYIRQAWGNQAPPVTPAQAAGKP